MWFSCCRANATLAGKACTSTARTASSVRFIAQRL